MGRDLEKVILEDIGTQPFLFVTLNNKDEIRRIVSHGFDSEIASYDELLTMACSVLVDVMINRMEAEEKDPKDTDVVGKEICNTIPYIVAAYMGKMQKGLPRDERNKILGEIMAGILT